MYYKYTTYILCDCIYTRVHQFNNFSTQIALNIFSYDPPASAVVVPLHIALQLRCSPLTLQLEPVHGSESTNLHSPPCSRWKPREMQLSHISQIAKLKVFLITETLAGTSQSYHVKSVSLHNSPILASNRSCSVGVFKEYWRYINDIIIIYRKKYSDCRSRPNQALRYVKKKWS